MSMQIADVCWESSPGNRILSKP